MDSSVDQSAEPVVTDRVASVPLAVSCLPHHEQYPLCLSRPRYRQGRKLTAVKVYTVNDESVYLLVSGVPAVSLQRELCQLCQRYGQVLTFKKLPEYPSQPFADVYLVKYSNIKEARFAKRLLDGKNFYGGIFHVCYAPELETVNETFLKLEERRKAVKSALAKNEARKLSMKSGLTVSSLGQYHPDDKLAANIKRITDRLSCVESDVAGGKIGLENNDSFPSTSTYVPENNDFPRSPYKQINNDNSPSASNGTNIYAALISNHELLQQNLGNSSSGRQQQQLPAGSVSTSSVNVLQDGPYRNWISTEAGSSNYAQSQSSINALSIGTTTYSSMRVTFEPGIGDVSTESYSSTSKTTYKKIKNKHKKRSASGNDTMLRPKKIYRLDKSSSDKKILNCGMSDQLLPNSKANIGHTAGNAPRWDALRADPTQPNAPLPTPNYTKVLSGPRPTNTARTGSAQLARLQQLLQQTIPKTTSEKSLIIRPAPDRENESNKITVADGARLLV